MPHAVPHDEALRQDEDMSAPLTTRDALAEALRGHAWTYPDTFCECGAYVDYATWRHHYADALLASGALTDATKLAEDEALMFRMGAIQVDLEPGYEPGAKLRQTITQQAAADVRALTAALSAQSERAEVEG